MIVLLDNQTGMIAAYDGEARSPIAAARMADEFIDGRRHIEASELDQMEPGYVGFLMPDESLGTLMNMDDFDAAARVRSEGRFLGSVRFAQTGVFVPPVIHVMSLAA